MTSFLQKNSALFCVLTFIVSCTKEQESIDVKLDAFSKIEINSAFDIHLSDDETYSISAHGNPKSMDGLNFYVKDSILHVEQSKKWRWLHPKSNELKLLISSPNIKEIRVNESCSLSSVDTLNWSHFGVVFASKYNEANLLLDNSVFYFWNNHPCGGKLALSGKSTYLQLWTTALLQIDASHLTSQNATIDNGSKGDIKANVLGEVEVKIKNSGNVILTSTPTFVNFTEHTGKGQLIY